VGVLLTASVVGLIVDDVRVGREKVRVERERARADVNFQLAREAINKILVEVAEAWLPAVPRADGLRLQVADDAVTINDRLLAQNPDDPRVRADAARINREAANILRMLGQHDRAASYFRRAIELLEALSEKFPENLSYSGTLALTLVDAGESLRMEGRSDEAEEFYRRALKLADRLIGVAPTLPGSHRAKAASLMNLAEVQIAAGRHDEAQATAARAVAALDPLTRPPGATPSDRLLLAMALSGRAEALRRGSRPREAKEAVDQAIGIADRLIDELSKGAGRLRHSSAETLIENIKYARAAARAELGLLLSSNPGDLEEALRSFKAAIDDLGQLAQAHPRVPSYRFTLAEAYHGRAGAWAAAGQPARADDDVRLALDLLQKLVGEHRRNAEFRAAFDSLSDLPRRGAATGRP
jgi:tetratricopeptide (TPR) repeat protein